MNIANSAARGGAASLVGQLLRFIVQLLSVVVLARLLTPSDFGLFAMIFAVFGIANILGDFGLSMAAIQAQSITKQQRTNLFWTNAAIGIFLFLIALLTSPILAVLFNEPRITHMAQILAVIFLLSALSAQFRAEASIKLKFISLSIIDVFSALIGFLAGWYAAVSGLGTWALIWQQIGIASASLIGVVLVSRWWPGLPRRGQSMSGFYKYGINTVGVQILVYVTSNIDSVLIGRLWGPSLLGLYDRAFQVFRLPLQQVAAPMTRVALPVLSKLQSDNRYEGYVLRAQLVLGYLFGGLFFLLAALSSPLIDLMLGPGWESASAILAVLALGGIFQGMGFVYSWVFLSKALTGLQLRWALIGRSCMVAVIALGVIWGPLGAAVGASVGQAINWILLTIFPIKKAGVKRSSLLRIAIRPILLYLPITSISLTLSHTVIDNMSTISQLFILCGIYLAYLVTAALFAPIRRDYLELFSTARYLRR